MQRSLLTLRKFMIHIDKASLLELISTSSHCLNFTLEKIDNVYCLKPFNGMPAKQDQLTSSILQEVHGHGLHKGFCEIKVTDIELDSFLNVFLLKHQDKYNIHPDLIPAE